MKSASVLLYIFFYAAMLLIGGYAILLDTKQQNAYLNLKFLEESKFQTTKQIFNNERNI